MRRVTCAGGPALHYSWGADLSASVAKSALLLGI